MFPDQDLLGHLFSPNKWIKLPWYYNAIKTFRYWHGNFYTDEEVRVLHYIVDKPWNRRPKRNNEEETERSGRVYEGDLGRFEEVWKEEEMGKYPEIVAPAMEADGVTHGWWWEEWEELVWESKGRGFGKLSYLEGLVAK